MSDFSINVNSRPKLDLAAVSRTNTATAIQAGKAEVTGLAEFNTRAGVEQKQHGHHVEVTLQRRLVAVSRRGPPRAGQHSNSTNQASDDLHAAGVDVVDALRSGSKAELADMLEGDYDALERHALLRDARAQIDSGDLSEAEKDRLKEDLNGMMSDLMDSHGDVIRTGLKSASEFESAASEMDALARNNDANHDPDSLLALRAQYGAKGEGRVDAPLTPMALAKSLQNKFGVEHFSQALGNLRSKMSVDLRSSSARDSGPRLWLSLSDAAAFNAVQSSFSIAGDLRRDLSERGSITLKVNQAGTAVALLGVAELGVSCAEAFIDHLVDSKDSSALRNIQLYMLVRQAVEKLSITMWRPEMLHQRMTLLDELRALASLQCGQVRVSPEDDSDLQLEQQLRTKVQRKKERSNGNDNDNESDRGSDSDGGGHEEDQHQDDTGNERSDDSNARKAVEE